MRFCYEVPQVMVMHSRCPSSLFLHFEDYQVHLSPSSIDKDIQSPLRPDRDYGSPSSRGNAQ